MDQVWMTPRGRLLPTKEAVNANQGALAPCPNQGVVACCPLPPCTVYFKCNFESL